MGRPVTDQERQIMLDNPELVMFNPYRGLKAHRPSILVAFIPVLASLIIIPIPYLIAPDRVRDHTDLYVGFVCTLFFISIAMIPLVYIKAEDRIYDKDRKSHYIAFLHRLLPQALKCTVVTIDNLTVEKAEGEWIFEEKKEFFGFVPYVNAFRLEPGMEMAVVYDGNGFEAFIKRDPRTETFYMR